MKRGPTARRAIPKDESLEDAKPSEGFLERCWQSAVARDPLIVSHDLLKRSFLAESIKGNDVAMALHFLARATGDPAFKTAALAVRAYGLEDGGLKARTLGLLRENRGEPEWLVMPFMMQQVRGGRSIRRAAMITCARYGIPGPTFATVVRSLTLKYPEWKASVEIHSPATAPPSGDTGRKLRVKFARPWLGTDNQPMKELLGVIFDEDGFGLAPDNRQWRQWIHDGHIALFGVIDEVGKTLST
jgi:hypothetical protein